MHRPVVAGVAVAAALLVPGTAAAGLVLGARDAPGLKPARATVATARKATGLPALRGKVEVSRFAGAGSELWSVASVLKSPGAAGAQLRRLRAATAGERRVSVGNEGFLRLKKGSALVFWRRRDAVGVVLVVSKRAPLRATALAYARVVDVRMNRVRGEDAWQRALDGIRPDGSVPRKTALDLFALAYGPLPGTKAPAGPRPASVDGTLAEELVLRILPKLSSAQRVAALRALGLAGIRSPKGLALTVPECSDSTFRPDEGLQAIADHWVDVYSLPTHLGHVLTLKIVAGSTAENQTSEGGARTLADAGPLDDGCKVSNAAKTCRIRVTRHGLNQPHNALEFVMAHEVFHCFEYALMSPEIALSLGNPRLWLIEGMADWAALSVKPLPYGVLDEYQGYLDSPQTPLFERVYQAAGFFGHLEDSTGDLWPRIPAILKAPASPDNFNVAQANTYVFLDSWSASTYNQPDLGFDWTMVLPLSLPPTVDTDTTSIFADASVQASPYTFPRYVLETDPDLDAAKPLVHIQIAGYARLTNPTLDTVDLEDAWFCVRERCDCPKGQEGSPPPAPPLGASETNLALSAPDSATAGKVTFVSLEDYCKTRQKPPPDGGGSGGGGCGGCGGSNGDPHLHTFDNRYYDFQAAGEFVLARSKAGGMEVQARQQPFPGKDTVSINTAFAMRVAADRVGVYRGDPLVVRVNGRGFIARSRGARLPHGGSVRLLTGGQVAVKWPDGSLARVLPVKPWGINVLFRPAKARFGTFAGLWGNFNGTRGDDWVTRAGRKITVAQYIQQSYRVIYRVLGESWRVRPRESLFDYARGQSTRTFTIRSFPKGLFGSSGLTAKERAAALRACKRLHIKNPQVLADCTLDVGATGDNRFATGSRIYDRSAGKFTVVKHGGGGAVPTGGAETRWTAISHSGNSNLIYPSLALDGGKVVVAYGTRSGAAESATFTPSAASDASAVKRTPITSGWSILGAPQLLPRGGGGVQVLLSGIHGGNGDPLNGTSIAARNPDGTFAAPVPASNDDRAEVDGPGVLAPDGQPLWPAAWHGGLYLAKGATGAVISDLSATAASAGVSLPRVGRDASGRYWVAYRSLGKTPAATGSYLFQINPTNLQAIGAPKLAPGSAMGANDAFVQPLPCSSTCRLVYQTASNKVVSWAYGDRAPTTIVKGNRFASFLRPTAAYTSGGRLWTIWWNDGDSRYEASFGNAAGAGGKVIKLGRPAGLSWFAGSVSAITIGNEVIVVNNWGSGGGFSRYVNVVTPR
jgi:hypothetical protein